jgi:hypothetical protein
MNKLIDKMMSMEKKVSSEKGEFSLFALFLREDAENKWDIVVSSPWLEKNKKEGIKYLAKQLKENLDQTELLSISRIVSIEEGNPALESIHRAVMTEHNNVEIKDSNFFGLQIKHAYIITSKKPNGINKAVAASL